MLGEIGLCALYVSHLTVSCIEKLEVAGPRTRNSVIYTAEDVLCFLLGGSFAQ